MRKFPFYKQHDQNDCGPTCLRIVSKSYGKSISSETITSKTDFSYSGTSIQGLVTGAEEIGFKALAISVDYEVLRDKAPLPCIAYWRQTHFFVIYKVTEKYIYISDPAIGLIKYDKKYFLEGWELKHSSEGNEGILILLEPTAQFLKEDDLDDGGSNIRFLLQYLRPHRKIWGQIFVGLLAITVIRLSLPFISQAVVDYGIAYENPNFITILLVAQLVLFSSRVFLEITRDWLLLHIGARISLSILSDFLVKLMKLPISFFTTRRIGDLLQRVQDHRRIEQFLSAQSLRMIFSILNLFFFGLVLAYFSWFIFGVYFVGTTAYIIWVFLFMKKREKIDYMRFDQMSANQSSTVQIIEGMQEIKLNGSERRRRWEWEDTQVKYYQVEMKNLSLFHKQRTGGHAISELKDILITFIAAQSVIDGNLTLGTLISIQYIIGQLNPSITSFIDFLMSYQNAMISIDRVSEIHNVENEEKSKFVRLTKATIGLDIHVNNLSFQYPGSNSFALRDFDAIIPNGKVTAIVGESGSGKTTLLKLLLRFYQPNEGQITLGEHNLSDLSVREWRKKCGVVMQDGFIFGDTFLNNITESDSDNEVDMERVRIAARMANIDGLIESYPGSYETLVGYKGTTLSGGQRQRLLICRAIYKNPQYLFFDEATSSLDAQNEKVIMNNLRRFYQGKTAIIVAHRLSTVKDADQILVLHEGSLIEQGSHAELIKQKGKYFSLIKNQLELGK